MHVEAALGFVFTVLVAGGPDDSLVGTWVTERPMHGRPFSGRVEVMRSADTWTVWMGGETFPAQPNSKPNAGWIARTPDGVASVQFRISNPAELHGFWVQHAGPLNFYPWSTPLRFHSLNGEPNRWAAMVRPYQSSVPLMIRITRGDKGKLNVLARDPERNLGLFIGLKHARRQNQQVIFTTRRTGSTLTARLVDEGSVMVLDLPDRGLRLTLRRLVNAEVRGFRARHTSTPYIYRRPTRDADWSSSTLKNAKIASAPIEKLVDELARRDPKSVVDPMVHALLVARRGQLVLEEYFFGHGPETRHDTRSAGKSLASMLVGAVVQASKQDALKFVEQPFCQLAPAYAAACSKDARKKKIALKHLLSMTSGLACDDDDESSPGNEGRMQDQSEVPDWYRYTIEVPMARSPGKKGVYCTAGINMVGAALKAMTGRSITQLFDDHLARPLGISHYHYNLSPTEDGYLGGGLRFRARDLLKFGELMRQRGKWKGRQILSEKWVDASTSGHASIHEANDYGLGWWRQRFEIQGRSIDTYYASGNGGQLMFVVPQLELVVLFFGGNYNNFGTWRHFRDDYLPRILAAAQP